MVSVTSHLRAIIRPLAVTSIIVLFFVFLFNYNLSSYRSENSIPYVALGLIGKTSEASSVGNATPKIWAEIKTNASEIKQLTTLVPRVIEKKLTELCPVVSPKLGKSKKLIYLFNKNKIVYDCSVGWTNITSEMKEALLKEDQVKVELKMKEAGLGIGGRYEPIECRSRNKVAIVVPYRDRKEHLTVFLHYLHPFLQRQQLNYVIIIVEQSGIDR